MTRPEVHLKLKGYPFCFEVLFSPKNTFVLALDVFIFAVFFLAAVFLVIFVVVVVVVVVAVVVDTIFCSTGRTVAREGNWLHLPSLPDACYGPDW